MERPTKEHYLLAISRETKLAHTSVKRNLELLEKEDIITKRTEKKASRTFPLYKANLDSKAYKEQKIINNLQAITETNIIAHLETELAPKAIVLFGSYLRGEDIEDSDVDLFVECKEEPIDLRPFEKKLKRKIQLHFNEDFFTYPLALKNNIVNGLTLHGFLEAYA